MEEKEDPRKSIPRVVFRLTPNSSGETMLTHDSG